MLLDSTSIHATHTGQLTLHDSLSAQSQKAHILDGITNSSLISLGQLCDDDCVAILDKQKIEIYKNNHRVLYGPRNRTDGLWDIPLPGQPTGSTSHYVFHKANAIVRKDQTKAELAEYLYGCCGSPAISTFKKAIKNGNFITWPGIDTLSLDRDLLPSIASAKGHLDQKRKNLQSTRTVPTVPPTTADDHEINDFFPVSDAPNVESLEACASLVPFVATNTAYHDLTGRFPHRSSRGSEYLLIVYDHDSNSILQCPLKNKTAPEIKQGWMQIHDRLIRGGHPPKLYILDNSKKLSKNTI